jgi:hypothetical protein
LKASELCAAEKHFIFCSHFSTKSVKNATIQRPASGKVDDLWLLTQLPSGLLEESLLPVHVCVEGNE